MGGHNNCVFAPGVYADPTHQAQKQDPADLTPQRRFVAAEAIECEISQICQTQKAAGELDGVVSFHVTVRVSSSKHYVNNITGIRK